MEREEISEEVWKWQQQLYHRINRDDLENMWRSEVMTKRNDSIYHPPNKSNQNVYHTAAAHDNWQRSHNFLHLPSTDRNHPKWFSGQKQKQQPQYQGISLIRYIYHYYVCHTNVCVCMCLTVKCFPCRNEPAVKKWTLVIKRGSSRDTQKWCMLSMIVN